MGILDVLFGRFYKSTTNKIELDNSKDIQVGPNLVISPRIYKFAEEFLNILIVDEKFISIKFEELLPNIDSEDKFQLWKVILCVAARRTIQAERIRHLDKGIRQFTNLQWFLMTQEHIPELRQYQQKYGWRKVGDGPYREYEISDESLNMLEWCGWCDCNNVFVIDTPASQIKIKDMFVNFTHNDYLELVRERKQNGNV